MWKFPSSTVEMAFTCTPQPMPKVASAVNRANALASLFHAKPALQRIHGAAQHAPVLCFHAVFHGNQRLGILGGDAQHAGQPAPQHGARPAQRHRCAHAHNIARADGGRQRRGKRAELADIAVRPFVLRHGKADAQKRFALNKACAHRS